jgi:diguanylate cyclase (GGDEF)-like protein
MHKQQIEMLKQKTKNLNILYVEDDLDSRQQVTQLFDMLFNSITLADNGEEGLQLYNKGDIDLVITDINMPKMNGITMSEKIKEKNPTQKIIIVSAHDNGEYLLSAIRAGVDGFILKPVEIEQFQDSINKVASAIINEKLQLFYQEELEVEVAKKTRKLLQQAYTDDLTGLNNRKKLMMDLANNNEKKVLILLNIDNFDHINSTYGYKNSDYILQQISKFFEKHIHPDCTLYKFGYDEFAFVFLNSTLDEATAYANDLQKLISKSPISYENVSIKFTATIVLSEGTSNILREAYIAFKETRQISKNRIVFYNPKSELETKQKTIQKYIHIVHDAIENRNIEPYFQPIINNATKIR